MLNSSEGEKLQKILESIDNGETQLPDFQRGWVWEDKRIKALIASISNAYPIGAAMFLDYSGCDAHFKCRLFEGVDKKKSSVKPLYLVLDGQQRATSLYRAIFSKDVVETCDDKKKSIKRYYYLNIPKCLDTMTDRIDAIESVPEDRIVRENIGRDIKLDLSTPEKEYENHCLPLNIIFDKTASDNWEKAYWEHNKSNLDVMQRYFDFKSQIINKITEYRIPLIILDKKLPKEAVCQVFENVNQGGVSLTVFELVTATFAADNFELRKDWDAIWNGWDESNNLCDKSLFPMPTTWSGLKNENIIKFKGNLPAFTGVDFLTAMTLLANYYNSQNGGKALSCKKRDVLSLKLEDYKKYRSQLLSGISETIKFIKGEHIYSSVDLPYSSQLIPLCVLFAIDKNLWYGANNKNKLRTWYWCGVFGELYGGANETRYVNDVAGMMKWVENDELKPDTVERSNFHFSRLLNLYTRNSAAYKGVMALILKNGAVDFISGGNMDFASYLEEYTDIHHIFPQTYCIKQGIERKYWNSVVNKTPIYARSNRSIGGVAPSVYTKKIEKTTDRETLNKFITSHLVDVEALRSDDFKTYFEKRAQALCDLIESATGKIVEGRYRDE